MDLSGNGMFNKLRATRSSNAKLAEREARTGKNEERSELQRGIQHLAAKLYQLQRDGRGFLRPEGPLCNARKVLVYQKAVGLIRGDTRSNIEEAALEKGNVG